MNINEKSIREKYKEFYGKNTEQMELLIKDKRIPLTLKQVIERRLNSNQEDWKINYFDTCDGVVVFKDKFKIIKDCKILKEINSKTKITDFGIKITEKEYKKLKGKEFSKDAPKEKVIKYLLEDLYDDYIKLLGYCPNYYLTSYKLNLRAFCVDRLGCGSLVGGGGVLGLDCGRLVGLAEEVK